MNKYEKLIVGIYNDLIDAYLSFENCANNDFYMVSQALDNMQDILDKYILTDD